MREAFDRKFAKSLFTAYETSILLRGFTAGVDAALSQKAEPGWVSVPVEPTPEMEDAAGFVLYGCPRARAVEMAKTDKFESAAYQGVEAYRAMLAAAPKAKP